MPGIPYLCLQTKCTADSEKKCYKLSAAQAGGLFIFLTKTVCKQRCWVPGTN